MKGGSELPNTMVKQYGKVDLNNLLHRTLACQNNPDRPQKDHEIKDYAAVLDIVEIVHQLLARIFDGIAVGVIDLRPAGDSGRYHMPFGIIGNLLGVHLHQAERLRPRTDQAHFALEDIQQLGHFIQPRLAYEPAHPGKAVVIIRGPVDIIAISAIDHGPQLPDDKRVTPSPHALLRIEYRPPRIAA